MSAVSRLVLLSVMMISKWGYVCAQQDATVRLKYSGRLYVGMQMETRGGFTFQGAAGGSSFMVNKGVHFRASMPGAPPAGQANSPAAKVFFIAFGGSPPHLAPRIC